jgi:thiol-disulfide isomerase/thioredoxin
MSHRRWLFWLLAGLVAALATGRFVSAAHHHQQGQRIPGGLEGGVAWINTGGPIHLEDLRGKIVLLDFWTFCCINCHHVLPELAKLEEKYKNELVVIGVHTPKFPAEHETENIRKKVREYGIKHPVINDANMVLWNRFNVQSWPTLALIDAKGNYLGAVAGEGHGPQLDEFLGELIAKHEAKGEMDKSPVHFALEQDKAPPEGPLRFPGKIVADAEHDRLFIADTGHNRIVITDLKGKAQDVVGNGEPALKDGGYAQASFNRPQGMCLLDDDLYVADVENHAVRAIHLKDKQVETVAGTGKQSYQRQGSGPARTTALSSPWDVIPVPGTRSLAIAIAGVHQIWKLDLDQDVVGVMAGTGGEDVVDGPYDQALFAQPSGLATDGKHLFVADSEVSGIRSVDLDPAHPVVTTIIGTGLFDKGDVDGKYPGARLQHCLGLAYGDGHLYVADTYNNKIKICNPKARTVHALVGSRKPGHGDNPPHFDMPGGLSLAGPTLYVADTNNHAIRTVNLETKAVSTLALSGLAPPSSTAPRTPRFLNPKALAAAPARVAPGKLVTLAVTLTLARNFHLNGETAMPYLVQSPDHPEALDASLAHGGKFEKPATEVQIKVPLAKPAAAGESLTLKLSLGTFVCKKGSDGFCKPQSYAWTIPVTFEAGAGERIELTNAGGKGQ